MAHMTNSYIFKKIKSKKIATDNEDAEGSKLF